ncbi:MAG: hypothetical protein WD712_00370 [Candidatus Spechtbacterales bacterium]
MKRLFILSLVLIFAAGSLAPALAHTEEEEAERAGLLERAGELREEYEARRQETLERADEIRQERIAEREERRVQFRAELEERLSERAKNLAEKAAERLNSVNANVTDAMLNHLNALENHLNALMARIDRLTETSEADLASTVAAAEDAYARINAAREAVLAQKNKVYTVEVDSLDTAGETFRAQAQQLREDLRALLAEEIRPSKDAVRAVFAELKAAIQATREENEDDEDENEDTGETS